MLGTENKNCLRSQDGWGIVLWAFGRSCGGFACWGSSGLCKCIENLSNKSFLRRSGFFPQLGSIILGRNMIFIANSRPLSFPHHRTCANPGERP